MGYIIIKNLYKQYGGGNLNLKKNLSGEKINNRIVIECTLVFNESSTLKKQTCV